MTTSKTLHTDDNDPISSDPLNHDRLHRFSFAQLPIRGQWVRLSQVIADSDEHHNYPTAVSQMMSQMYAAVAMFADNLKFSGAVTLQSRGDGDLIRTLAECRQQNLLRGIAHFRETTIDTKALSTDHGHNLAAWLGAPAQNAQLVISLIPSNPEDINSEGAQQFEHEEHPSQSLGPGQTYQGIVEMTHNSIAANLESYFATSEQLPTQLYFAHPDQRAGVTGLLLQKLPYPTQVTEEDITNYEQAWHTIQTLASTVTNQELATLNPEEMLNRLFAEYPCRLYPARSLSYQCTCNRQKTDRTLRVLDPNELEDLLASEGEIRIDCEFCGKHYTYTTALMLPLYLNQPT